MSTCATYIARAKARIGDKHMSDERLGAELARRAKRPDPFSQSIIARSKNGRCPDSVAVELERVLSDEVAIGEILLVARAERENDQVVKERLMTFAKNVVGRLPEKITGAIVALVMAIGLAFQPQPSLASSGGDER